MGILNATVQSHETKKLPEATRKKKKALWNHTEQVSSSLVFELGRSFKRK